MKLPQLAVPRSGLREEEWIEDGDGGRCGGPFVRPQHEISQAELIAREQFPGAAARILQDLRHGHDRRRFSTPAISTLDHFEHFDLHLAQARRATLGTVPTLVEDQDPPTPVAHRREKTWGFSAEPQDDAEDEDCQGQRAAALAALRQLSKTSVASSSARWKQPESVIIIVDWDDTIFPTSWIQNKEWFCQWFQATKLGEDPCRQDLALSQEELSFLEELDAIAESFFLSASALGRVSCVTLAQRPWQLRTMRAFLPRLTEVWEKHSVTVLYAREEKAFHGDDLVDPSPAEYEMLREMAYARKKQKSMERLLRKFYKKGSWKNVISLGDGPAERRALQEIGFQHLNPASPRTGEPKTFRTKTVKMLEEPSCSELISELQMIQAWMPALAMWDEDVDVDLTEGEEALLQLHEKLMEVADASGSASISSESS